jgi:hypothetical protein
MSTVKAPEACIACGKTFVCGMGGAEPCWCSAEFPAVMPLPEGARGCYCRDCLAGLIEQARRDDPATGKR